MRIKPNKPGWIVHKFEDLVENAREQVMPIKEDSKKYIGLEHLDSGSLHVRRWGTKIQLKGTKFRMKKCDLLFARRNAYLKRVAIAPHDGLFSAHGMIFRSKNDVILPDFLPFFISSDLFMDRAIEISVGSLSPTINWGTLRHEGFSLPPLDEQKRLADLLWSVDETIEHYIKLANKIYIIYLLKLKEIREHKEGRKKIGDIANLHYGVGLKKKDRCNGAYSVIGSSGIVGKHSKFLVEGPGIIIGRKGSAGEIIWVKKNFWPIDTTFWVEIKNNKVMLKYFFHALKSINLASLKITTAIPGINRNDILSKKIYIPKYSIQLKIIKKFEEIWTTLDSLNAQITCTRNIQKQIINKIFGGQS